MERTNQLLRKMLDLLEEQCNDGAFIEWIMHFLGKVQSNFIQMQSIDSFERSLFCLDVFSFCLVVVAGCQTFITHELSLKNKFIWINKLPEAVWLISKTSQWSDHMPRVRSKQIRYFVFIYSFAVHFISDLRVSLPFENSRIQVTKGIPSNSQRYIDQCEKQRIFSPEIHLE